MEFAVYKSIMGYEQVLVGVGPLHWAIKTAVKHWLKGYTTDITYVGPGAIMEFTKGNKS